MKTLADFKREMTLGSKWHGYNHAMKIDFGVREVTYVSSTSFTFKTTRADGKVVDSWLDFPKASHCKFRGDGTIEMYEDNGNGLEMWATYKKAV